MSEQSAADTIEVVLPSSKKTATIRNYTKDSDDVAYNAVLFDGVDVEVDGTYKMPILNSNRATRIYVQKLTLAIDGDTEKISEQLSDLRSEDYKAIEDAVRVITKTDSPKAKAGK